MKYKYECRNKECPVKDTIVNKPMDESSRPEFCKECGDVLYRTYSTPSISTSDGFKK